MEKRPSIAADEKTKSRKEQEWADDREEESSSPYEPCYRDGSVKHECWRDDQ